MDMSELVDQFMDQENIYRMEGEQGIENISRLLEGMGYFEHSFKYGSVLEVFLADNPGALQALVDWISDQHIQEWQECLESRLEADESDEDEYA